MPYTTWRYWFDIDKPIISPNEWRTVCCKAPIYQAVTTQGIYSANFKVEQAGRYSALYCMDCKKELERGLLWGLQNIRSIIWKGVVTNIHRS